MKVCSGIPSWTRYPFAITTLGVIAAKSHKMCYYTAMKKIEFIGPKRERKQIDEIDLWVAKKKKHASSAEIL